MGVILTLNTHLTTHACPCALLFQVGATEKGWGSNGTLACMLSDVRATSTSDFLDFLLILSKASSALLAPESTLST